MNVLLTVVLALQMLTPLGMIGLILIQHGKGADMGAAFGSGSSGSLFGAIGSANFLSRSTAVLAALFFVLSLSLAWVATNRSAEPGGGGVMDAVRQQQEPAKDVPRPQAQPQKPAAEAPEPAAAPAKTPEKQVPQ